MALIGRREVLHAGEFAADASAPLGMTSEPDYQVSPPLRTIADGRGS